MTPVSYVSYRRGDQGNILTWTSEPRERQANHRAKALPSSLVIGDLKIRGEDLT